MLFAIAALIALAAIHWPTLAVALLQTGPGACPWGEVADIDRYDRELQAAYDRLRHSSRKVSADGEMELWELPAVGRIWFRRPVEDRNLFVFAEQLAGTDEHSTARIHRGDVVLDCGADYGSVTRHALEAGARIVVAIEIAPQKIPCLKRTFANEIAQGRVIVVPVGVWDREDVIALEDDSVVLERNARKQMARVTTIDRIVAGLRLPRVDFIAMDIEGAEKHALRGAAETLRRFRPRMAISSEHLADDAVELPKTVRAMVPAYRVVSSRCVLAGNHMQPRMLFFRVGDK